MVGIDPTTGAEKFRVLPQVAGSFVGNAGNGGMFQGFIIAGDGNLYAPYAYTEGADDNNRTGHLRMLQVGSDGTYQDIKIYDWPAMGIDSCRRKVIMSYLRKVEMSY